MKKRFFPALIEKAPQAKESVDELERQHVTLHENWAKLSEQLEELIAEKRTDVDERLITLFVASYDRHLALEEPLFELGKQYLSAEQLTAMGKIMFARRRLNHEISIKFDRTFLPDSAFNGEKALANLAPNDELVLQLNRQSAVENFVVFVKKINVN